MIIISFFDIPWNSLEFHGASVSSNQISPSSMEFYGIGRPPILNDTMFHGVPWNIPWNIPCDSMEFWGHEIKCGQVSWNPINLGDRQCKLNLCSIGLYGAFHYFNGSHVSPKTNTAITNSMGLIHLYRHQPLPESNLTQLCAPHRASLGVDQLKWKHFQTLVCIISRYVRSIWSHEWLSDNHAWLPSVNTIVTIK